MPAYVLFMGLLLVVLAGAVGYALGRSAGTRAELDAETVDAVRREITALRALVANLKDPPGTTGSSTPTVHDHHRRDPHLREKRAGVSQSVPKVRGSSTRTATVLVVVVVLAVVALGLLIFARPSTASTGPDQVALHYKGGAFSSKRFADCIAPSNRVFDGPGDSHFAYPSSQTNFVFDADMGSDGNQITFVTATASRWPWRASPTSC